MKKQLNVDAIKSELRGGSAFFPGYQRQSSPGQPAEHLEDKLGVPSPAAGTTPEKDKPDSASQGVPPPVPRTVPRTNPPETKLMPKAKRAMKQRQPFDIYEDQYACLKEIADTERGFVNGRGMSQMVREAIDAYLAANYSSKNKRF